MCRGDVRSQHLASISGAGCLRVPDTDQYSSFNISLALPATVIYHGCCSYLLGSEALAFAGAKEAERRLCPQQLPESSLEAGED